MFPTGCPGFLVLSHALMRHCWLGIWDMCQGLLQDASGGQTLPFAAARGNFITFGIGRRGLGGDSRMTAVALHPAGGIAKQACSVHILPVAAALSQ